jgi:crossover junction endodeoxyribonuclease RuvC
VASGQGHKNEVLVLGIDPGSRCTGYGLIREASGRAELVDVGTIRPPKDGALDVRLGRIFSRLAEIIAEHCPDEAAVEDVFAAKNAASALKLGQARGAAIAACAHMGVPVSAYAPTKIKQSLVGAGRAEKGQVAFMVGRVLGVKPDWAADAADALACAVTHLNERRARRLMERTG